MAQYLYIKGISLRLIHTLLNFVRDIFINHANQCQFIYEIKGTSLLYSALLNNDTCFWSISPSSGMNTHDLKKKNKCNTEHVMRSVSFWNLRYLVNFTIIGTLEYSDTSANE